MTTAAIPYVIAAVGTAASIKASNDAAQERRSVLNNQLASQEAEAKKSAQMVQTEAKNYDPEARQQALTDQENALFDKTKSDIAAGGAGGAGVGTSGSGGNLSADFLKANADRSIDEGNRLTSIAREAAKTRAPNSLMTNEGQRRASMMGTLQSAFGSNGRMAGAAQLDASGVTPGAYGQIAQAAGTLGSQYLQGQYLKSQYPTTTANTGP